MEYVTVELPKFLKDCEQLEGETEEQLFLLSNMGRLRERPEKFSDQKFDKLFQVTTFSAMNYYEQMAYVHQMMAELDARSEIRTATETGLEQGLEQGRKQGLEQGLEQGRAEGEAAGLKKGREEERADVARAMKAEGISTEVIAKCTGLSEEEIREL